MHEFLRKMMPVLALAITGGVLLFCRVSAAAQEGKTFNARDYGAVGDGQTTDTTALQKAIDAAAAEAKGGVVLVSPGKYLTGTIFLKSNITLRIEKDATILGILDPCAYPKLDPPFDAKNEAEYAHRSLIAAANINNVTVTGEGTIDGQGGAPAFNIGKNVAAGMKPLDAVHLRPYGLRFVCCRNVTVTGLTLKNSAFWMQTYLNCEDVRLEGLTIRNKCNGNNDGIDIDGSRRVRISNCDIKSGDDAICIKSLYTMCEDVTITSCALSSACSGFKFGTASRIGFRNFTVRDLLIYDTRLAGIALEIVDGGVMENISISNVTMRNVGGPIFVRLGGRGRDMDKSKAGQKPPVGTLRKVVISDVTATAGKFSNDYNPIPSSITGLPEHPVQDVTLRNIRLVSVGGADKNRAMIPLDALNTVPEKPGSYPEYTMFGELPAYGFYVRHAEGVTFENVEMDWATKDFRPAVVCDDAKNLTMQNLKIRNAGEAPLIVFNDVNGAKLRGCTAPEGTSVFIREQGKTEGVLMEECDLGRAAKTVEKGVVAADGGKSSAEKPASGDAGGGKKTR